MAIVTRRRRLLNYLHREDAEAAGRMANELGIRFRPSSAVPSRAEKYAAFRNTKQTKKLRK